MLYLAADLVHGAFGADEVDRVNAVGRGFGANAIANEFDQIVIGAVGAEDCAGIPFVRWTGWRCVEYDLGMTFQTDAIYEGGVLRPLLPLSLRENEVVSLIVSTSAEEARSTSELIRDHSAFLNSYAPEDEGLYDDYSAG